MQTNFAGNHATIALDGQPPAKVPDDPLLTDIESAKLLGCARSTIWKWVAEGIVPKPIKIGGMSRFFRSEMLAVVENAKAAREVA